MIFFTDSLNNMNNFQCINFTLMTTMLLLLIIKFTISERICLEEGNRCDPNYPMMCCLQHCFKRPTWIYAVCNSSYEIYDEYE